VLLLCSGLALLAMAATTPALAGKKAKAGVTTRSQTVIAGAAEIQRISATATCPGRLRALGGGFSTSTNGAEKVVVHTSRRAGRRSWTNEAVATRDEALTSYVYCRRMRRAPTEASATAVAGEGPPAAAVAKCPGARKAVSGGFSSTVGPGLNDFAFPAASLRRGDSWAAIATSGSGRPQTITAYAYCAKRRRPPARAQSQSLPSLSPFGFISATSGRCAKGRRTAAGGFAGTPPRIGGPILLITQSRLAGSVWTATAMNDAEAGGVALAAQAICG
jgi:hypothetical protein